MGLCLHIWGFMKYPLGRTDLAWRIKSLNVYFSAAQPNPIRMSQAFPGAVLRSDRQVNDWLGYNEAVGQRWWQEYPISNWFVDDQMDPL